MPIYFETSGIREMPITDTLGQYSLSAQNALHRRSVGHRQDPAALTGQGRIAAASRPAACCAGVTNTGLVCIAPDFHTSLHDTATEGQVAWWHLARIEPEGHEGSGRE